MQTSNKNELIKINFQDNGNLAETMLNQSVLNQHQRMTRTSQISMKYNFALMEKTINILNSSQSPDSIQNLPIVCSHADMQFKISVQIQRDWSERLSSANLNLGYSFHPTTKQIILRRIKHKVGYEAQKDKLVLINSMLTLYYLVVREFTSQGDQVLLFTPTYYRFAYTLKDEKRQIVEYELRTKKSENGETEFYIDFQELSKIFQENKIKLLVFANPHNPAGKIWHKQQLCQLKDLCLKHNVLIFSDDIFFDCIQNPRENYVSLVHFPEIHQNLIWAGSFGKAFNCSGNSFTYVIVENKQIKQKLYNCVINMNLFPTWAASQLLQSCYTVGDGWRLRTIKYVQQNFAILKSEIEKRNMKINLYKLESAFLPVLDFTQYKWPHSEIKKRLQSQNIFPTYLQTCYIKREKQSITCVRFNLAMNRQVLDELIDRLERALKN